MAKEPRAPSASLPSKSNPEVSYSPEVESAKARAEASQEQLVTEALSALESKKPKQAVVDIRPPAHPCKCADLSSSKRARFLFAIMLQARAHPAYPRLSPPA